MSFDDEFEPGNLDEEVLALPDHKKMLAFKRACLRVGIAFEETAHGTISLENPEEDLETEEFEEAFGAALKEVYLQSLLDDLVDMGLIEVHGVDPETGLLRYGTTSDGVAVIDDYLKELGE